MATALSPLRKLLGHEESLDSVSGPLIVLCWQSFGVPRALAEWLVALDFHSHARVRMNYA